jgi:hypothetical protein
MGGKWGHPHFFAPWDGLEVRPTVGAKIPAARNQAVFGLPATPPSGIGTDAIHLHDKLSPFNSLTQSRCPSSSR